jgi:hypothetical protein
MTRATLMKWLARLETSFAPAIEQELQIVLVSADATRTPAPSRKIRTRRCPQGNGSRFRGQKL